MRAGPRSTAGTTPATGARDPRVPRPVPPPLAALLLAAALVACAGEAGGGEGGAPGQRTSLVLVVIDTLRADHLGAYGHPYDTSPVLDRLAAEGVLFERCFSTSSWTRPGMATLFTGQHPRAVGVYREQFDRLPDSAVTLAERLAAHGYRTIGITSNPNLNEVFGFAQGFDRHLDAGVVWQWMEPEAGAAAEVFDHDDDNLDDARTVTDRALEALDREPPGDAPFYLRVVYIDPHEPYQAPAHHLRAVARAGAPIPEYDAEVRYADAQIGRLLEGLEQRGLLANTLVAVTSDHGEGLTSHPGVPESRGHGTTLYDSTTHVPLILWHPALPAGRRVDALVSTIHLVPTVMELLGLPLEGSEAAELPGSSLAALVTGRGAAPELPAAVFSETEWRRNRKLAVRTEDLRLIRNEDCALYQADGSYRGRRLSDDQRRALAEVPPLELYRAGGVEDLPHNLTTSEAGSAAELEALLADWDARVPRAAPVNRGADDVLTLGDGRVVPLAPAGDGAPGSPEQALDPETLARLRALGYVE